METNISATLDTVSIRCSVISVYRSRCPSMLNTLRCRTNRDFMKFTGLRFENIFKFTSSVAIAIMLCIMMRYEISIHGSSSLRSLAHRRRGRRRPRYPRRRQQGQRRTFYPERPTLWIISVMLSFVALNDTLSPSRKLHFYENLPSFCSHTQSMSSEFSIPFPRTGHYRLARPCSFAMIRFSSSR